MEAMELVTMRKGWGRDGIGFGLNCVFFCMSWITFIQSELVGVGRWCLVV